MKKCRVCGKTEDKVRFQSKRAECVFCRRKAERRVPDPIPEPVFMQELPTSKTYVVTYAQNATQVHKAFMASLLVYCKHKNAELIVIPGRYKNPTSIWSAKMEHDEWWDASLGPYLFAGRAVLGHVTIYGDISIQPTAVRPLTGFEVFAGANSAVFGHPKIQLHTIATAKRRYPRIFTTTGAITKPNYTRSKAGKKGEAHHVYGATVIEASKDLFHLRQINATSDGAFIDLDTQYSPKGVAPAGRALALVCGDIHVDKSDAGVLKATFTAANSIVRTLRPKKIVYHDVLDFDVRNHHTIAHFPDRYERAVGNKHDSVEGEVMRAINFLDKMTPENALPIVIQSNHDEAFDRWLQTADPKHDPVNARFFHEAWYKILSAYDKAKKFTPAFELFYKERGGKRAQFIDRETPLKIGGIYCNFHGDKGLNGSKGSSLTYAKLGVKTVVAHAHQSGILDGCYRVGVTGRLDMDYNSLPSSWMNSHCVIYPNFKRCLIHVLHNDNGECEWRG